MNEYGRSPIRSYPCRPGKSSYRRGSSTFNMFFGRRGLVTGSLRWAGHEILGTPSRLSYSRSRSSRTKTYYTFKTSSDLPQLSLIDINLRKISNKAYSEIIDDYLKRMSQYEKHILQQRALSDELEEKTLHLKRISFFLYRFLFTRKIETVTYEINNLTKQLNDLKLKQFDTSLKLENIHNELCQSFIDSFYKLFDKTKISLFASSEYKTAAGEIPTYCHYYRIRRKPVMIGKTEGPIDKATCCSISVAGLTLFFYSTVLVIKSPNEMAIIDYKDLTFASSRVIVVEDEFFDTKGYNVYGYEYLHQCKDGSIDLRYKYNPGRPKIRYSTLILKHKQSNLLCFILDKDEFLAGFIQSFDSLK